MITNDGVTNPVHRINIERFEFDINTDLYLYVEYRFTSLSQVFSE